TANTHAAVIDWNDGTTSGATVTGIGVGHQVSASHTYATGGVFHVVFTVTDDDGGSAALTTTVFVGGARITQGTMEIVGTSRNDLLVLDQSRGRLQLTG